MSSDPDASLGDQQTTAGRRPSVAVGDSSLSDASTFGGGLSDAVVGFDDEIEAIDLASRYVIDRFLGQGGMGEVLLATDRRLKRQVAIKRVRGDLADSQVALRRFLTEAQSIARLNHFNIVQVYDYGRDSDGPFLILEYVDGQSLLERLRSGPLPPIEAVELTCQLCDGLSVAHEAGIIHRDIKPANILLTRRNEPKLSDFGLARQAASDGGHTSTGAILGTLDFVAPEQRRDASRADALSDQWSLAATLYQMVTGEIPRVIDAAALPESLRAATLKALKTNPAERHASISEFGDALRQSVAQKAVRDSSRLEEGHCGACGAVNDLSRKFCKNCGGALREPCPACGVHAAIWERYCGECGADILGTIDARLADAQALKGDVQSLRTSFQHQEALQLLEPWLVVEHSTLQELRTWAEQTREKLTEELEQLESQRDQLLQAAQEQADEGRPTAAEKLLGQIPDALQNDQSRFLAERLAGDRQEADRLSEQIRAALTARDYDGLEPLVVRYLDLRPRDQRMSKLREKLRQRSERMPLRTESPRTKTTAAATRTGSRASTKAGDAFRQLTPRGKLLVSGLSTLGLMGLVIWFQQSTAPIAVSEVDSSNLVSAELSTVAGTEGSTTTFNSEIFEGAATPTDVGAASRAQSVVREWPASNVIRVGQPDGSVESCRFTTAITDSEYSVNLQFSAESRGSGSADLIVELPLAGAVYPFVIRTKDNGECLVGFWEKFVGKLDDSKFVQTVSAKIPVGTRHSLSLHVRRDHINAALDNVIIWGRSELANIRTAAEPASGVNVKVWNQRILLHQFSVDDQSLSNAPAKTATTGATAVRSTHSPRSVLAGKVATQNSQILDGTWVFTGGEQNGKPLGGFLASNRRLTFNGDRYQLSFENATIKGRFQLDTGPTPWHLDWIPETGGDPALAGILQPGICELSSDKRTLKFCVGTTSRPLIFDGKPAGYSVQNYTRLSSLPETSLSSEVSWKTLFNGSDLSGWSVVPLKSTQNPRGKHWTVIPDEKILAALPGDFSDLRSDEEFQNFRLLIEWRFTPGGTVGANGSGIMVRSQRLTTRQGPLAGYDSQGIEVDFRPEKSSTATIGTGAFTAYEANLENSVARVDGIQARTLSRQVPPRLQVADGWNQCEISCDGDRITVLINGQKVNEAWGAAEVAGAICLRNQNSAVQFRNIRVQPLSSKTTLTNSIGMELVKIPAGEFLMGTPNHEPNRGLDELPHRVRIGRAFFIGMCEVTQRQYQTVMGKNPSYFARLPNSLDHPVEQVSWDDAVAFCRALSELPGERAAGRTYRLPTEAEWEYACRAGTTTAYCFGDDAADLGKYARFGGHKTGFWTTQNVGAQLPNAWGLHDMHGNVWEWCSDEYGPYEVDKPEVIDPKGPQRGVGKVARGGSWDYEAVKCRSGQRYGGEFLKRGFQNFSFGFRVVMEQGA